jgi:hypothetical protein
VEVRPALNMEALLETAAALAGDARAAGHPLLPPLDLALLLHEFGPEIRAPLVPAVIVRSVTRALAWLAARRGLDARYRRARLPRGLSGL